MALFLRATAAAGALLMLALGPARAEDVTLAPLQGGMAVSGRLISYDGMVYQVQTRWGRLSINAEAVTCQGVGCPDLMHVAPSLRLALEPWLIEAVLLPRLQAHARREGLRLTATAKGYELATPQDDPVLRLQLLPLQGATAPILAAGEADAALGHDPKGRLIAKVPLSVVSGPLAPQLDLPLAALQKGAKDWQALGGDDRPLIWHDLLQGGVLDRSAAQVLGPDRPNVERSPDLERMRQALARDPWGLALWPGQVPKGLHPRSLIQSCGLPLDLSPFAQSADEHPLLTPIHLIEGPAPLPLPARQLLDALAQAQLTPPPEAPPRSLSEQPLRLLGAISAPSAKTSLPELTKASQLLAGAKRLPLTFRTSRDPQEQLDYLTDLLATSPTGTEALLIGFTHSGAKPDAAKAAAQTIADALRDQLPDSIKVTPLGLGEIFPILCPDNPHAAALNTRVEVWIRL